jgi:hypothetical protein
MRTIVERFGHAFDAFCYTFRRELSPKLRGLIYVVSFFAVAFFVAHMTDLQHQRELVARDPEAAKLPRASVPIHTAPEPLPAYLTPRHGTDCIDSYSNLQNEAFKGLSSSSNEMMLMSQTCKAQRKTLQLLTHYPRDQRDEFLAALFDAAAAHR